MARMGQRLWLAVLLCALLAPGQALAFTATSRATGAWNANSTWSTTRSGTIVAVAGSPAVAGVGTAFLTELGPGVVLTNGADTVIGTVSAIISDTALTLTAGAAIASAGAYKARVAPLATDDVVIADLAAAHTVTVTASATGATLQFPAGAQNSILAVNSGVPLTMNGDVTVNGTTVDNRFKRLDVLAGGQLLVNANLKLVGGSGSIRRAQLRLRSSAATTVTVIGDLTTTNPSSVVTFSGLGVLNIGGDYPTGGRLTFSNTSLGTVVFNAAANQRIGARRYPHLTIAKTGGTATLQGNTGIGGDLTDNGNFNAATPCGLGTVTFSGVAPQSILGTATNTTFCRVAINNTAAVANRNLTLGHDITIDSRLTFSRGRIVTNANTVIVTANAANAILGAIGAPANRFVAGNLRRRIPGGASTRAFPVGSMTPDLRYAPVSLTFPATTTSGFITVATTPGDHPNIATSGLNPIKSVNRYWTLTNNSVGGLGAGYQATFNWVLLDVDSGANTSLFEARRWDGSAWNTPSAPGARTATRITVPGITGFGDFQVGEPAPAIDHFFIDIGATSASTCSPKSITITAQDVSNNTVTNYAGTINITTSSNHGDWSIATATGALSNGTADDGAASYTFTGAGAGADNGVIVLALTDVHADDLTITVADNTLPATSSTSLTINFRDNAFVVAPTDALGTTVVAGRDHAMKAELWRKDPSTGNCAIAAEYTGGHALDAWITRDAADPGGTAPSIAAGSLPNAPLGGLGTDNLTLTFAAGVASFDLATGDVGKYALNLRDDSRTFATGVDIEGSSATLTVRPFGLHVDVSGNPGADTPAGTMFKRAGENFAATVSAVAWAAADDAGNDGTPDGGADLSDNPVTPSFAWDTTLSAGTPFEPSAAVGGVLGTLSNGALAQADYSGGAASVGDLQYAEVGSFTMTAAATGYLGSAGVDVTGSAGVVGRFAADHFQLTVDTAPSLTAACATFTYIDQDFDYGTAPRITAEARAAAGTAPLQNYHDFSGAGGANWWRLDLSVLGDKVQDVYTASGQPAGIALDSGAATYSPNTGSGTHGSVQFTLAGPFTFADRDAAPMGPVAPFSPSMRLDLTVTDADDATGTVAVNPIAFPNAEQRWGRLRMENAFGSELLALAVPMKAEYYNGSGFVTNTEDGCSVVAVSDLSLSNNQEANQTDGNIAVGAGTTTASIANSPLAAGEAGLSFSAPGGGNVGYVDIGIDLDAASPNLPWLRFDWDGDGNHDNDPAARATFGIFSGPGQHIYIREPW